MHSRKRLLSLCGLVTILVSLVLGLLTNHLLHVQAAPASSHASPAKYVHACGLAAPGFAHCDAMYLIGGSTPASGGGGGPIQSTCAPNPAIAYAPCDLQVAYNLPFSTGGNGKTVAIIDAYDDPNAEIDLGFYRSYFGLPDCTTANGCFRKVNQNGVQGKYPNTPPKGANWTLEISLDLDMVSAICPNCHLLLVEAKSTSDADLDAAVDEAAALGANVISNSYGIRESKNELKRDNSYNHPGIAITASSGDHGLGAQYPAASPFVTAVGGTALYPDPNDPNFPRGWIETAWFDPNTNGGSGAGCSQYEFQPFWQHNLIANESLVCTNRMTADVSAVAANVAFYDSFRTAGNSSFPNAPWIVGGGTSVSAPIIAGVYALAGNESGIKYGSYPYSHTSSLNDVIFGSNSTGTCTVAIFCNAVAGWDGPTGLGTPNGLDGF